MVRATRKRAAETEPEPEPEHEPMEDDAATDDDEEEEDMEEQEPLTSPSSAGKKDMRLRSGKRKRRRSKETSGLTPTDTASNKKARKVGFEEEEQEETNGDVSDDDAEADGEETNDIKSSSAVHSPQVVEETGATNGRDSLEAADFTAVAELQDPELSEAAATYESSPESPDAGRRLFDSKPPPMGAAAESKQESAPAKIADDAGRQKPKQVHFQSPMNGEHEGFDDDISHGVVVDLRLRLLLVFLLSFLCVAVWPLCVGLADLVVPLNDLPIFDETLLELPPVPVQKELKKVKPQVQVVKKETIPASILEGLRSIDLMKDKSTESQEEIRRTYDGLARSMEELRTQLEARETQLYARSGTLTEATNALVWARETPDLSTDAWKEARSAAGELGLTLLDTPSVDLWEVGDAGDCPGPSPKDDRDESNPVILAPNLEKKFSDLLLGARMSAVRVIENQELEEVLRTWIRSHIQKILKGNDKASAAIAELESPSEPRGLENIEQIIQDRLEMERADRTGEYDHASILNGGKVIYGGKRGTTKSMVDSLPLFNRLMQLSELRFYGYGPDAAVTPTYPLDALGQCWSFMQTPLKDQLKRRRASRDSNDDDHKRGNFGTLTISLPTPVTVLSVVIEHPPKGLTDQIDSAIRAFRIIGYTDAMSTGKSWSLGSFEYDINKGGPLQEFEVATDIFGAPVPPLQSITLAVDSNWGNEYACLYRFRVHGDEEDDPINDVPLGR